VELEVLGVDLKKEIKIEYGIFKYQLEKSSFISKGVQLSIEIVLKNALKSFGKSLKK
jgi:hypothetical protein